MSQESLFQYRAYSKNPFIKREAERLFECFQESRQRKVVADKDKQSYRKAFRTALAGMYLGGAYDDHGSFVRVPLNKNHYYGSTRISPVFQPELLRVFNWLIDSNIMVMVANSYHDVIANKEVPRGYRLSDKWLERTERHVQLGDQIKLETTRKEDAPLVELRDENKRNLRLKPSKEKDWSIELLRWYNNEIKNHKFQIIIKEIPTFSFSLTRIYSRSSYKLGGRFYSLFQGFRSQTRLHLKIDGEPVFEVDLSSLHPTMLYRMAGMPLAHDPYAVEGHPRAVVKIAMQVLLNTQKPFPSDKSLSYWLNKAKKAKGNRHDADWQSANFTRSYCKSLAESIAEHNKAIAGYFSQGIGLTLQHHDSIFTSAVLYFFKQKNSSSIVVPIHDSYLVKQSELSLLLDAIEFAEEFLSDHLNWEKINPRIKIESLKLEDPIGYKILLMDRGKQISSSIKEELINEELTNNELEESSYEDAYDLDLDYYE